MAASVSAPWPWYVAGPLIGLFVPALLLAGNRLFGFSSNLRHLCAAVLPGGIEYFRYNWKRTGSWNLLFAAGVLVGAYAGGCTSGHAISGLADLQLPSLIAVVGFFAGGLIATYFLLPLIL
jgi:uncharacterized membrane protein YedE/YeeE